MNIYELNIDGLVGPTHHYAGLSTGNIASTSNAQTMANPRAAALQGIDKMRLLHRLGVKQAIMPPHPRPNLALLRQLGFSGNPTQLIQKAFKTAPDLLSACYSASSMWTANMATTAPSHDTADKRVHFTPANLIHNLHRHQEAAFSQKLLQKIFADGDYFHHHLPVPSTNTTKDEGAANHNRLCKTHGDFGIHLFVYNQQMLPTGNAFPKPQHFPARQTREASEAVARNHQLNKNHILFAQQNPAVVDQGVFHNDVIAVANEYVFLVHEDAFLNQHSILENLQSKIGDALQVITIHRSQFSVTDAVKSYFFNSQLVTLPHHKMALIAPTECEQMSSIKAFIDELLNAPTNPITEVHYLDLKQSMRNGGGPACLRLRVVLNEQELSAMHQGVTANDALLNSLEDWVTKYYRTELNASDLVDPALMDESSQALDALSKILQLGGIYDNALI